MLKKNVLQLIDTSIEIQWSTVVQHLQAHFLRKIVKVTMLLQKGLKRDYIEQPGCKSQRINGCSWQCILYAAFGDKMRWV